MLVDSHSELKNYKREIETYRSEIESMRHQLETLNEDNMAHIVPRLQLISDAYNQSIQAQRKENDNLQ